MPTYNFICSNCDKDFEHFLSFVDFDKVKCEDSSFIVDCPHCQGMKAKISFDECPHSHVVNTNNVGIHIEKNSKKIGKTKIEEETAIRNEKLAPKTKPNWYGRLSKDKQNEIINPRKSKEARQAAATKYILNGE